MATEVARSKIRFLAPLLAPLWATPKTFSKTRGTATMNVGLKSCISGTRRAKLLTYPMRTPSVTQATCTTRARMWASGRKASVELSASSTSRSAAAAWRASQMRLRWVSAHPFGRPVVPDVYTSVPRSS